MWFPQILLLFAISSVGPGFFFARRWRLSPAEKLVVSVGLSYLMVYVGAFAIFAAGLAPGWQSLVALASLGLNIACLRDLKRLFGDRRVRRLLAVFGAMLAWGLLLLGMVRGYGGGTWSGDWLEHYQRSLFFLGGAPRDFRFIEIYLLPARPPLMNVVAAHFLALAGTDYEVYQVVFLFLNGLVLLPCCLLAADLIRVPARRARRLPWIVLLLLAANPMVCQNLTYAWTKLFTAFYVLLALHLYLRAWRKGRQAARVADAAGGGRLRGGSATRFGDGSRPRFVLAFAGLCGGFLVHYSAGPYAVFIGLHYLLSVWWRRRRPHVEAAAIVVACSLIFASWFAWSVHAYGVKTTLASNSSVIDAAPVSAAGNLRKVGHNLLNTMVPAILRHPSLMTRDEDLAQPTLEGRVRDFAFLCYQVSVPFGLGAAGMLLVGYLLYRLLLRPKTLSATPELGRGVGRSEQRFWLAFIPFVLVVGVAVHGAADRFGVAHICLQGLVLIGLCLLAAGWRGIPSPLRWVLVPGLVLDLALGVFLHFGLESRTFPTRWEGDRLIVLPIGDYLSRGAQANWYTKVKLSLPFWGDSFAGYAPLLQTAAAGLILWFAWQAWRPERFALRQSKAAKPGPPPRRRAQPDRARAKVGRGRSP